MRAPATEHLLFVYGSLKRGRTNHVQLGRAVFLGAARTRSRFALRIIDGYPALVSGGRAVVGELYRIATTDLARLDEFEGEGYERQLVELETSVFAFGYLARRPDAGEPYPGVEW